MKNLFILGCLILLPLFLAANNLLLNPGFESWTSGKPDYWIEGTTKFTTIQENDTIHSDSSSCKIKFDSTSTQKLGQHIKFSPYCLYACSLWVFDNSPFSRVRFYLGWYDDNNNFIASNLSSYSSDTSEWQLLTLNDRSPFSAESLHFEIRLYDVDWGDSINSAYNFVDDAVVSYNPFQPPFSIRLFHKPTNPSPFEVANVYAIVRDVDGTILDDSLYYGVNNWDSPNSIYHNKVSGDTLFYTIPSKSEGNTVFYYLWMKDDDNLTSVSDTNSYFVGDIGVVINEICYDNPGVDTACFVELFGPPGMNLNRISVVGVNGRDGKSYANILFINNKIPGDGFFVIAQDEKVPNYDIIDPNINFQNGPDNVELRYNNITIDALGYKGSDNKPWTFTGEGSWVVSDEEGNSLSRYPDGYDTDNNAGDFSETSQKTPGEPNASSTGVGKTILTEEFGLSLETNCFFSSANFLLSIPSKSKIDLSIYNSIGQKICTLRNGKFNAGRYKIKWNIEAIPSGIYFCHLKTEAINLTKKLIILK